MISGLVLAALFGATVFDVTFERANTAYDQGDFGSAANLYEQLVADGIVDAALFYNLGNAYYRLDRLGPAIANYERALHLNPLFEEARRNLEIGIERTKQRLGKPLAPAWEQGLFFWHQPIAPRAALGLSMVSWTAFWLAMAVALKRRFAYSRLLRSVLAVLALAFGASAWVKYHPAAYAVVIPESISVRYGTSEADQERFQLFEGDRVLVDEESGGWARVTTGDGRRGWVQTAQLAFVGPPYIRPGTGQGESEQGKQANL